MREKLDRLADCIRSAPRLGEARKREMLAIVNDLRNHPESSENAGKLAELGASLQSANPELAEIIARITAMLNGLGI